jgi:murein DD-endopeptidase MepM/ murein hydrolase activator NlpD
MASRIPAASPFANSRNPLTLVIGSGPTPRLIAVKPWVAVTGTVLGALLMGWYLVATLYIVFKDEMLGRLISQQTEMQHAYEDRLAALRNQIDRVTSRQLVDQNSIDAKLQELLARHAQLETRHALVAQLASQPSVRQAIRPETPRPAAEAPLTTGSVPAFAPQPRPVPTPDGLDLRIQGTRDAKPSAAQPFAPFAPAERKLNQSQLEGAPPAIVVAELRNAADRIERQQMSALEGMERQVRQQAQRFSQAFAETGLDAERFAAAAKPLDKTAQGGPLVAVQPGKAAGPFEQRLNQAHFAITQAERMRRIVNALPTNRPMPDEFEQTSGYGPRSDPFTRSMAMHTGIDFRAPTGSPVRATASGKVVEAGWVGGYGNMVEIDHGNGLTTRYAHLSSIAVSLGDTVARGATIGRVGSTGRSTGPHLHYETRVDGDPADPVKFIRAGQKLQAR